MEDFNVPIGCFDGAEVCELVGSFILQQLSQLFEDQLVRLYRYDGLAIFKGLSGSETKRVKKKNHKSIYRNPDNHPVYINKSSNHSKTILREILNQ